uniref:Uncharacterized protein n=1 Tax=Lactuca sativa TaxID=4236 RepID=A0A9R1UNZ1_LACSA|nr:hypothetical protein LSAT_V11C800442810 [Lactuca sativa]
MELCYLSSKVSIQFKKIFFKQMGFGTLLKMKMTKAPWALSCYVVENFHLTKMKIILQEGVEIDVTRESFSKLPFQKENDKSYDLWTEQFKNKKMIILHEIKMNIVTSDNADMNFEMKFIALFINSLIKSSSAGKENTYPLKYIMNNTNINNVDWCSYLLSCLVKTKLSFDLSSLARTFFGSSTFLVAYRVHCRNSEKMKLRETYEKEILKEFGIGHLNEVFVKEDINQEPK